MKVDNPICTSLIPILTTFRIIFGSTNTTKKLWERETATVVEMQENTREWERRKGVIDTESSTRDRSKKKRTENVAHTGELVPSARCEEYLCKAKQKREELEKYTNMIGR